MHTQGVTWVFLSYPNTEKRIHMIWGHTNIDGWFFSNKWNYYQRCEGNVTSYIERMFGFYRVHVTYRGQLGMCDIEYRNEDFGLALEKTMELLDKYKGAEKKEELHQDYYSTI